jgi:hypothetical protein
MWCLIQNKPVPIHGIKPKQNQYQTCLDVVSDMNQNQYQTGLDVVSDINQTKPNQTGLDVASENKQTNIAYLWQQNTTNQQSYALPDRLRQSEGVS